MKNKIISILVILCLLMQVPMSALALKQGYLAGPNTYALTSEYCTEAVGAVLNGDVVTLQSGGKIRYGFYLPFEAESITFEFDGSSAPITVSDGENVYTVTPAGDADKVTHKFETVLRIGEKDFTFTAGGNTTFDKITFNKKTVTLSDSYDFKLPALTDEEFAVQGAVLINIKASAFMANGSTRYVNADDPTEIPKNINGKVYLPAHTLARAFGAYYEEILDKNYVLLREPISKAEFMFTSEWAYLEKDGKSQQIDNCVIFDNGKAYLPVRIVAEAFNRRVDFYNNLIAIDDNKYYVHDELYDPVIRGYIDSVLKPFIPTKQSGKIYHVAQTSNASDVNPGTEEAPFKTISKAGEIVNAGDTVIVHQGTYRETVTVKNNGEPTRPIVFKAADGEDVVISALEVIDGFAEYENGMYVASFPWNLGDGRNQLYYNGTTVPEARYPNGPGIDIGDGVEPLSDNWPVVGDLITDPANNLRVTSETLLNQEEDNYWKGAYFVTLRGNCYTLNTARVESSTKGELKLDSSTTPVYYWDKGQNNHWNWGYLVGHRNAIDLPGEWVIENNTLFIIPPEGTDGENLVMEAKRRQLIADLADNKYVQLRGFTTIGGSMRMNESEMCLIDDCTIKYNNHFILSKDQHSGFIDDANIKDPNGAPSRGEVGIYVGGKNNVFTNNRFEEAAGAAIYGVGLYTYIENNYIANCGYAGSYVAGLNFNGEAWEDAYTPRGGHLIVQNSAFNCGRSPLQTTRPAGLGIWPMVPYEVAYNEFYNGMLASLDTGIVYTYYLDHGNSRIKTKMHNNYVYYTQNETNPYSMGIYHDGGTQNIDTFENIVFTTQPGVKFQHDPVFIQTASAAVAICNEWNNIYVESVIGGRDGLKPEHYPQGVKPFDAGCTLDRDVYMLNYDSRSIDNPIMQNDGLMLPDEFSDGIIANDDGSLNITGDGQWIKFNNVDFTNVSEIEVYYKGDKYKLDDINGYISVILDNLDSVMAYTLTKVKINTTYFEHSLASVSRGLPIITGSHDMYLKFSNFTDIDAVGIKLGTKVHDVGKAHQNIIYGGNFSGYMQPVPGQGFPTANYNANDTVNPFVNNTWNTTTLIYENVQIDYDANELIVNCCTGGQYSGQKMLVRLNSLTSEPIAEFVTPDIGWGVWNVENVIPLNQTVEKGAYTVYVTFEDEDGERSCNLYYLKFVNPDEAVVADDTAAVE